MRHAQRPSSIAIGLTLVTGLALAVAACGGATTGAPDATQAPTLHAPTEVPGDGNRTPTPTPGTFETAWGTAWDALPPGFPVPAGAVRADPGDPADGPVSGAFTIDGTPDPAGLDEVVRQVQSGLGAAGYSTEALSGPLEDGSLVIDSVGQDSVCRVQTRVRPLGATTMLTVLFGAACPWG